MFIFIGTEAEKVEYLVEGRRFIRKMLTYIGQVQRRLASLEDSLFKAEVEF